MKNLIIRYILDPLIMWAVSLKANWLELPKVEGVVYYTEIDNPNEWEAIDFATYETEMENDIPPTVH